MKNCNKTKCSLQSAFNSNRFLKPNHLNMQSQFFSNKTENKNRKCKNARGTHSTHTHTITTTVDRLEMYEYTTHICNTYCCRGVHRDPHVDPGGRHVESNHDFSASK